MPSGSVLPRVHLAAVVGGGDALLLRHLVEHYRAHGVESFYVCRHVESTSDPLYEQIEQAARDAGIEIFRTFVGPWDDEMYERLMLEARSQHPDDWYVVVDLDEFHVYDRPLADLIELAEHGGYDHVDGCFVDRVAADGGFPDVDGDSLWERFPLGGSITSRLVQAPSIKTGLALGRVPLHIGHHGARGGRGLPREVSYIQVHHFKWTGSVVDRMRKRIDRFESGEWKLVFPSVLTETRRVLTYLDRHDGRIDVGSRRLHLRSCGRGYDDYPLWAEVADDAQRWRYILQES
ncbi:glycosyltransferase family 2 protein [Micromonospora sp. CPCC 206061]|uniref:glycosyltransferase family 2 protein n=1 Tax=Micromonospora sp. CPCC 206061 TaxID=3122410 RepID=UPI002FF36FD2